MQANFLNNINHIHFIGINGSSMSGLALLMKQKGIKVTGSDIEHIPVMDKLISEGIEVYIPHDRTKITNPDLIVYTAAIRPGNDEYEYGLSTGIPLMERSVFLGKLMDSFKHRIGISGAHGKTTATTLTAYLMEVAGLDPTIHIGGEAAFLGSNVKSGNSEYFITEADEFKNSFLKLNPTIGVILNIDFDHVDWFKTFENMKKVFSEYAMRIQPDGYLIVCNDDKPACEAAQKAVCNKRYYGLENNKLDYSAVNIQIDDQGRPSYDLYIKGVNICHVKLGTQGRHNALNSLAAIAVMDLLGQDIKKACENLSHTHGAKRRFDLAGQAHGIKVYSDYAHHPEEIAVTIKTAYDMKHNRILAAFEAHTFSRVRVLFDRFVDSFSHADIAIIADIYNDREADDPDISGEKLANAVNGKITKALYLPSYKAIEDYLYENAMPEDIILVLGSKYLESICEPLVERLKDKKFND